MLTQHILVLLSMSRTWFATGLCKLLGGSLSRLSKISRVISFLVFSESSWLGPASVMSVVRLSLNDNARSLSLIGYMLINFSRWLVQNGNTIFFEG